MPSNSICREYLSSLYLLSINLINHVGTSARRHVGASPRLRLLNSTLSEERVEVSYDQQGYGCRTSGLIEREIHTEGRPSLAENLIVKRLIVQDLLDDTFQSNRSIRPKSAPVIVACTFANIRHRRQEVIEIFDELVVVLLKSG